MCSRRDRDGEHLVAGVGSAVPWPATCDNRGLAAEGGLLLGDTVRWVGWRRAANPIENPVILLGLPLLSPDQLVARCGGSGRDDPTLDVPPN